MNLPNHLTPVSYHLRNFNKYVQLDLAASQFGNLTLVGENAAGKTTLANCFFPMLIDGSTATPSFNPAKGTEKVAKSTNARNSQQDTRTFKSMLLGWGPSAMKVRTGYSYLTMRSITRQVILGLGARRTADETSGATWWFAVINESVTRPLKLVTTDAQGHSLTEDEFKTANAALGEQLRVFASAGDYREYVAAHVYGFNDGATLGQLANVYRLLASPILTGGNARFTPIKAALRDAQPSIDDLIIHNAAGTQREVNRKNGLLLRIEQAQKRLAAMKRDIFWRNLNHINEIGLKPYGALHADYEQQKEKATQAQAAIAKYDQQLDLLTSSLKEAQIELRELDVAKAKQAVIEQQRAALVEQIQRDQERLQRYTKQQAQLENLQVELTTITEQIQALVAKQQAVNTDRLAPLQVKLNGQAAQLHELGQVLAQPDLATTNKKFNTYIQRLNQSVARYESLAQQINNLSQDVAIVGDMQTQMSNSIERRTQGPLVSRAREGLQQDNRTIHENGAAKMNQQFQQLKTQRDNLLTAHSDLKIVLATADLLATLTTQQAQLAAIVEQLTQFAQQQVSLKAQQAGVQQQIKTLQVSMEPDFEPAQVQQTIAQRQQMLAALVIDHQLNDKLAQANQAVMDLTAEEHSLSERKSTQQGRQQAAESNMRTKAAQLATSATQIEQMLKGLAPYLPAATHLQTVDDANTFAKAHGSEIRNSRYSDIADRIRQRIHRSNRDGVDRSALDTLFAERGHEEIASAMYQGAVEQDDVTAVAFDINQAQSIMAAELAGVTQSLAELKSGNDMAKETYLIAAVQRISTQYRVITEYNQMLADGLSNTQGIKLRVALTPVDVAASVITEACDLTAEKRPTLQAEIERRLQLLANDAEVADDDVQFMQHAHDLLDTRQWSEFHVQIKRRQSAVDAFEEVDDKFVRSGGSGAEKAQAMVLPLLLVPKMLLQQSNVNDTPYLVMFDEFADKLDPETAKSFAKTIANFGFDFIATMPSGAQNKILADGVANIAYEVIAPAQQNDGQFHQNQVQPVLRWQSRDE